MAGRDERKLHDAHSVGFWVSASAVIPSLLVYDYHTGKERLTAGRGGGFWCLVFVFGFCKNRRRASERSLCRLYHTSELGLGVVAFTATPFAFFFSYSQSSHFFIPRLFPYTITLLVTVDHASVGSWVGAMEKYKLLFTLQDSVSIVISQCWFVYCLDCLLMSRFDPRPCTDR